MTAASLLATNNADFEIDFAEQPTQPLDSRRITEHDADFVRLHSRTARALKASVRQLVRELRADAHDVTAAQSRFIQRHMDLLRRAYIAAHKEGQRDYYAPISNTPRTWVSDPPTALVQKRLTWYGLSSVLKMAHEAQRAVASERHALRLAETKHTLPIQHTGVMVAFFLKPYAAKKLALPGGEPPRDMHITLTFLGDSTEMDEAQLKALPQVVAQYAAEAKPLKGEVSGVGRFNPGPSSEGKVPVIALLNVPGLQEWRAGLVAKLEAAGIEVYKTFAYTPHITLAYIPDGAEMPLRSVPHVKLTLDTVTLAIADARLDLPIGKPIGLSESVTLASGNSNPVDLYLANVDVRADLQANIAWSGLQDGYLDGGAGDSVGLYSLVWWSLEPSAQHCSQCPELAADSPYNAPGLGTGHELPATPGDGYTDCGGGCKCSLEYRSPSVRESIAIDRLQQALGLPRTEDVPGGGTSGDSSGNVPLAVPPVDGYTDNQRRALDLYRATAEEWAGWNDLGGGPRYPHFPPFAADSDAWEAWSNAVDWRTLPEKQRQLLWQLLEARLLWATPDGMEG